MISLLSPPISLQNRQKWRFEPTLKKCSCDKALRAKKPYLMRVFAQTRRPETDTKRPEVDTLTKRLEISCTSRYRGFESHPLRHQKGTKKMYPRKRSCKKQPMKNGGFQKWDPPLTFAAHLTCEILFCEKMGIRTTPPGNCGFPGAIFRAFLRRFLYCQLPQVVLVKVKTAGY